MEKLTDFILTEDELRKAKDMSASLPIVKKLVFWYDRTQNDQFDIMAHAITSRLKYLNKCIQDGTLSDEANEKEVNALIKLLDKLPRMIDSMNMLENRTRNRGSVSTQETKETRTETIAEREERMWGNKV